MVQFQRIYELINSRSWDKLIQYLDEMISRQQSGQLQEKYWLWDFSEQKSKIVLELRKVYDQIKAFEPSIQDRYNLGDFEQCVVKLFGKGLILPELNIQQDIQLFSELIQKSANTKYLFMLYQQNLCQIKEIYQSHQSNLDKVYLKSLSVIPAFMKLLGQNIFQDLMQRFHQFYQEYNKFLNEENIIGQPDKQVNQFLEDYIFKTLECLRKIVDENNPQWIAKINENSSKRKLFFDLLKLLHTHHQQHHTPIKQILNQVITRLDLSLIRFQELPSFWISDHMLALIKIYNPRYVIYLFGTILINELPARPQYAKIPTHLINILAWTIENLYSQQSPINSLSLEQNTIFYVQLFQRFSILMGILNNQQEHQSQINSMLKALFSKKTFFSNHKLFETLWRKLVLSHDDRNFKTFCLGQYKKIFLLPVKELSSSFIHIMKNGSDLVLKLVSQLEGNSNAQFIGFNITFVIYFLSFVKKYQNYFSDSSPNDQNNRLLMCYLFSNERIWSIKKEIKEKLLQLKQSLKDRLEVSKMKTNQNPDLQKQANQISICIYRIEEEIKFD